MNSRVKKYPDQIERKGFNLKKSQDEFIVHLRPRTEKVDIASFFDRNKKFVELNFNDIDGKSTMVKKFNTLSRNIKWVTRVKGRKETIDELMGKLETDSDVDFVAPVYFRGDLKFPNGFTFDDRITIKLNEKTRKEDLQNIFQELRVEEVKRTRGGFGKRLMPLRVLNTKTQNTYEIAQKLAKSDLIDWADVNWIQLQSGLCSLQTNDPWFGGQWNLQKIKVVPVWETYGIVGSPLVVMAIIDSGCDLTHPDLKDNYVQESRWYNAIGGDDTTPPPNTDLPYDECGHGTCVAGIATASGNNGQGIAGVCWRCRIMPIKICHQNEIIGSHTLIYALEWARDNHANIINMSIQYYMDDQGVTDKLKECNDDGIVLVASAANSINKYDIRIHSNAIPATDPHVIVVGATDGQDKRQCTSRVGDKLAVVAPGNNIWATDIQTLQSGYNAFSGYVLGDPGGDYFSAFGETSAAAPQVAGLAGLLLSYNPTLTPAQVRQIIQDTADDLTGDQGTEYPQGSNSPGAPMNAGVGKDDFTGYGRINCEKAIETAIDDHNFSPVDVYIRDALADNGVGRYDGDPLCFSPDIIVRKNEVFNPQAAFADMTTDPGSDNVAIGNNNYIYIRVHNKGNINSDIHARVYYAPLTTTCSPDQWKYIGQIDFYDVPGGGDVVSDALLWANVPDPVTVNHFCIIASIEGFGDPHPDPAGINTDSQYMNFIRKNNNISYRNVVFEDVLPNTLIPIDFFIESFAETRDIDLRIKRKEPAVRAEIALKLPNYRRMDTRVNLENAVKRPKAKSEYMRSFEFKAGIKRSAIRKLTMPPGFGIIARLEVKIPDDARPAEVYQIAVEQLFKGKVVGDFQIIGKVVDPKKAEFLAVRGSPFVHKLDCKGLAKTDRTLWVPFKSLEEARVAGYDMAIDCLNQRFTAKDVSHKLARKVLFFINSIGQAEDLDQAVKDTLGIGYFEGRYGKMEARRVGYGLGISVARRILEARDRVGGFTKITEIEVIKGVGVDKFIDLINSFK